MSQHDYDVANQSASLARADINLALKALASTSSGPTAPSVTFANQLWYDTTNDVLKIRNEANSAFITLGSIDQTNGKFEPNFTPATNLEAIAGTDNTKSMTPLRVKQAFSAVGSPPMFACRAWASFVASTGVLSASGNVAYVNRVGTGLYTVTFTTVMPDINYAVVATAANNTVLMGITATDIATTGFTLHCRDRTNLLIDGGPVSVAVFR